MKKIVFVIALLGVIYISPMNLSAAENNSYTGEPYMTDGPMDGGWWYRGTTTTRLISKYKHYTTDGHSSVRTSCGNYYSDGWKSPDVWSDTDVAKGFCPTGDNSAYYDNKL